MIGNAIKIQRSTKSVTVYCIELYESIKAWSFWIPIYPSEASYLSILKTNPRRDSTNSTKYIVTSIFRKFIWYKGNSKTFKEASIKVYRVMVKSHDKIELLYVRAD
jgi:hypothetical protein